MFKTLFSWIRGRESLLAQAQELVLEMLREDLEMFNDSVKCLWKCEGVSINEIRERDKQINRHVRDVRKKVLTHMAFSGASSLDTCLVLLTMVVYIERIGDYTKDITYLATDYPGKFHAGELEKELKEFERTVIERLTMLVDIIEAEDRKKSLQLVKTHTQVDRMYCTMIDKIIGEEENDLTRGQSAMMALYLRYLRRIEGHVFNLASSEVNPFHRIGFKVKKKV